MTNTSNKKKKKRGVSIKACIVMLAVVMLLGCAIGSTVAWLTAKTSEVTNTFTYGDINIELKEHKYDPATNKLSDKDYLGPNEQNEYKIIPGVDLPKDPKVTVEAGSEKCWLFVKVEKTVTFVEGAVKCELNLDNKDEWTAGTKTAEDEGNGVPKGVYYRVVDYNENDDTSFDLISGNKIIVYGDKLTKENSLASNNGLLTFTAYAIQYEGFNSAADAWVKASTN